MCLRTMNLYSRTRSCLLLMLASGERNLTLFFGLYGPYQSYSSSESETLTLEKRYKTSPHNLLACPIYPQGHSSEVPGVEKLHLGLNGVDPI